MLVFETAREVIGRLDGRPPQTIDRTDVVVAAELTDNELLLIASGGRAQDEPKMKFCRQWRRTEHLGSYDHIALLMPGPIGGVQEPDGEPHVLIDAYVGDGAISAPLLK